jgi:DNA-binding protein YbaB
MSGNIVSTTINYHWIKKIVASTNGGGVLKLTLEGDQSVSDCSFNQAEILIFTDDDDLTGRLIEAINNAAAKPEIATEYAA